MKIIAWLAAAATMVAAGAYVVISLYRWEWNRALFFGLVFLAAEVGCAAAFVAHRIDRVHRRWADDRNADRTDRIERAVRAARPDHERFPWLAEVRRQPVTRTNVFITMVVGGGVLLSGGAWLIDKAATRFGDDSRERRLISDLQTIRYPDGGLVVDDVGLLARPTLRTEDPRVTALLGRRR